MAKPNTFVGLEQSRYGSNIATKLVGAAEKSITDPTRVPGEVARLRQVFASDKTRSREWRLEQLNAMLRMMTEGRAELHAAIYKDLHKSPHEANLTEIDFTISEITHAIRHLDDWMAPKPAPVNLLNMPGTAATVFDPLGVVLIMGAWNYPILLTLSPLVGAIAAGNCAVIKPGSYAPETSHAMARLLSRYLDADTFVVCEGNRDVTDALLKQRFDMIFYTGSGFVGKLVAKAAAEHLTPVVLELGGKSPFIVAKCADLDLAATRLVWGSFLNSGQTCIRPDHCLVDEAVADKFLRLCKEKVVEMFTADPQKTENFGRIINDSAWERLNGILDKSRSNVYFGGRSDRADKYIEPTLLDYGTDSAAFESCAAMQDEIFGPILPVLRYKNFEQDVVQRVRNLSTGKPLALYVFAEDQKIVDACTKRLTSGGMCVNDALMHIACASIGFGGVGASGMGSYHGERSMKAFSHEKSVLVKYSFLDQNPLLKWALAARYPPYDATRKWLAKAVTSPALNAMKEYMDHPDTTRILIVAVLFLLGRRLGFRITRD